jgi:putative transposase
VERNPVRAKIVSRAEEYAWSSAAAHRGSGIDPLLCGSTAWDSASVDISDWSDWLREPDEAETLRRLRRHAQKNLPCGSDGFVDRLETIAGRSLRARPTGRPRKG